MEKFAVDLDRVLDEFEFNEDCAEQVASIENPSAKKIPPEIYRAQQSTSSTEANFQTIDQRDCPKIEDTLDIRKIPPKRDNSESVNDFHAKISDKVQQKRYAEFRESEPVSLTIRNDISHKKQQNDNASVNKNHNSYDKKLNQPNIKPSVSNVFSSLNDYINAPSGDIEQTRAEVKENVPEGPISGREDASKKCPPPEYHNILVPVKLDPITIQNSPQVADVPVPTKINLPEIAPKDPVVLDKDHVYENVFIPVQTENVHPTSASKHVYENVDFEENRVNLASEDAAVGGSAIAAGGTAAGATGAVGFRTATTTIDDLSEDELNIYLAALEAEEERATQTKAMYENVAGTTTYEQPRTDGMLHRVISRTRAAAAAADYEDANEAPIFETITIGVLPAVSEDKLHEKAKKFPIIDYSKQQQQGSTSSGQSSDFLEHKGPPEVTDFEAKETFREFNKSSDEENADTQSGNQDPVADSQPSIKNSVEPETLEFEDSTAAVESPDTEITEIERGLEEQSSGIADEKASCDAFCDNSTYDSEEASAIALENGSIESDINDDGQEKPVAPRPQTLDIVSTLSVDTTIGSPAAGNEERLEEQLADDSQDDNSMESGTILGKQPPFWIPDSEAPNCMLCDVKFNVIKRRHHCRACGKVLCNKCCAMKYRLEYQGNIDSRVCSPCYQLLVKAEQEHGSGSSSYNSADSSQGRQPNPNNPMEYCSTIPPLQQLAGGLPPTPTVMVPVGVLKREGTSKQRSEGQKSVMFSDGIRPGCDLTELDTSWDLKPPYRKVGKRTSGQMSLAKRQNVPPMDPHTNCYIPQDPNALPPIVTIHKGQITYDDTVTAAALYQSLKNECEPPVMFAINQNLYAYVKITNLNCCVNRICWNVTSRGLACVGQDEVILLVETLPDETQLPKDLLAHINQIYIEAIKGNTITELGVSLHQGGNFLGSREHAGFLFIRRTFQCLQKIVLPPAPFLVGLLVHRWETPWAKIFPLRLMLRLGAEYRYYPCPLVSVRNRDAVYFEIGHTVLTVLADFRNFTYTLPGVRGLTIHMQDRTTDVMFPKNRYDQVIKGLNNSNDHVLAFASNFSVQSDAHYVCIQTNNGDESNYQTHAIFHNTPLKVTGLSFIVINGALKSSMGLSAKSTIVEDGLTVQIMPEKMEALKASLKNMQDFSIGCGLQGAPEPDETVNIKWVDNDVQFNIGVKSPIDGKAMDGIPSIRVHNGTDYMGTSRFIRWTEVFIIKSDDHPAGVHDPVDLNKLSESIARATCAALVKLLDLLATAGLTKLAVRTTINPDNVGYEAGSEGTRLPPIYMKSLDNELIQVLHKAAQTSQDTNTVLELIFYVLDD